MSKVILFSVLTFFLISTFGFKSLAQKAETTSEFEKLNWLIGRWKNETNQGISYESWIKVSNRTLEGDSYTIEDGDTTFTEFLRIEQFDNNIFYTAKVAHNVFPVPFKLIKIDKYEAIFENREHDFPQRIMYLQKKDGSLHARIEGKRNGKEEGFDIFFTKVK